MRRKPPPPIDPPRPGLPAPESVNEVLEFTSPKRKSYQILKTTEQDAYDKPSRAKRKSRRRRQSRR